MGSVNQCDQSGVIQWQIKIGGGGGNDDDDNQ
jgi:hypothetical protein